MKIQVCDICYHPITGKAYTIVLPKYGASNMTSTPRTLESINGLFESNTYEVCESCLREFHALVASKQSQVPDPYNYFQQHRGMRANIPILDDMMDEE